ncbi:MAG: SurA N-terminal domain-containing protein [Hyphomicrobiales bacterium]
MLETLRSKSGGLIAKLFIGLLAMSFAVWGISDIFRGSQGDALATVGEQEIPAEVFRETLDRQIRQLSRQTGQSITQEEARQLGVHQQVLSQLVRDAALDDQAAKLNLAASDEIVAKRIQENPAFRGSNGKFDANGFRQLLASNGISEGEFVREERRNVLRGELVGAIDTALSAPETLKKAAWIYDNQKRGARYFVLPPATLPADAAPSDVDLKTFYNQNKRTFTAPEFRTLSILRLQPSDLADTVTVSDEDAKAAYEKRVDQYSIPEKRSIEQISFLNREEAEAARKKIIAGTSFEDIAKERGLTAKDYQLGALTKKEITDPAVALAAFELEQGRVSEPIEGALATALVRVTDIQLGLTQTFEQLKNQLVRDLKLELAKEEILNIHDQVEDERAAGSSLREIGQKLNLPFIAIDGVDASGNDPNGAKIESIPAQDRVLRSAFESDVGVENDPVETSEDGFVWLDVTAVTPEALKPFDEVKEKARELWTAQKLRELQLNRAQELVKKAQSGTPFDTLASENAATVVAVQPTTRGGRAGTVGRQGLAAIFNTAKGDFTVAPSPDNKNFMVMETTSVDVPPYEKTDLNAQRVTEALESGLGEDLLIQYLQDIQESVGVNINPQVWSRFQNPS